MQQNIQEISKTDQELVADVFQELAKAVSLQDLEAFHSIAHADADLSQLFLRNSQKLAMAKLALRLERVEILGQSAHAYFDVVGGFGDAVESTHLTLEKHDGDWRIVAF